MLKGKCPKCKRYAIGWALANPRHQICPNCGVGLDITEDGRSILTGYSPFTAENYLIKMPQNISSLKEKRQV